LSLYQQLAEAERDICLLYHIWDWFSFHRGWLEYAYMAVGIIDIFLLNLMVCVGHNLVFDCND
jgi:hypothetical protein